LRCTRRVVARRREPGSRARRRSLPRRMSSAIARAICRNRGSSAWGWSATGSDHFAGRPDPAAVGPSPRADAGRFVTGLSDFLILVLFKIPDRGPCSTLMDDLATRGTAWAAWGRGAYALGTIGFGVHHLVTGAFTTRVLPGWPFPGSPAPWALLAGALLAAAGGALLAGARRTTSGLALVALWLLGLLALEAPRVVARWWVGAVWTAPGKNVVLAAGALLLAVSIAETPEALSPKRRAWTLARWVLGGFLVLCGVQHFVYARFAATLVPRWIPGPMFWTIACGVALIACGAGLAFARTAPVAGLVAGSMIASWFLVLHIPRAVAAWTDPGEWSGVCESLAIAGVAWLVGGSSAPDS